MDTQSYSCSSSIFEYVAQLRLAVITEMHIDFLMSCLLSDELAHTILFCIAKCFATTILYITE